MSTSTDKPAPQSKEMPPPGHTLITEGQITMLYPQSENSVFYNPVQVQNRDLSVLMLGLYAQRRMERIWTVRRKKEVRRMLSQKEAEKRKQEMEEGVVCGAKKKETKEERKARQAAFEKEIEEQVEKDKAEMDFVKLTYESSHTFKNTQNESTENENSSADEIPGLTILDALAASGLRSLRYWKEVPGVRTVVVNDLDKVAVELARENVVRNGFLNDLAEDGTNDIVRRDVRNDNGQNDNAKSSQSPKQEQKQPPITPQYHHLRPPGIHLQNSDATHELYLSRLPPTLHPSQVGLTNPSHKHQKPQYDIIDLDPYGSASPFLDSAVQSITNGGLLAITCTDMAALGGSHPETCYGRYAGFPIQRSGYLQELAVRILLYQLSCVAARYGRSLRPILSVGMAFYVRVFVEVYDDGAGVNNLSLNHGLVFQSTKCSSFHIVPMGTNDSVTNPLSQKQRSSSDTSNDNKDIAESKEAKETNEAPSNIDNKQKRKKKKPSEKNIYRNARSPIELGEAFCRETGAPYKIAGPCWIGPLHDLDVVNGAIERLEKEMESDNSKRPVGEKSTNGGVPLYPLKTNTTLHGLLVSVSEELPDVPLYHDLTNLCRSVNSTTMPLMTFKAALVNAGYRVSGYHKEPQAIKTDAPNHVVWDVIREWCREHPPSERKEKKKHGKDDGKGKDKGGDGDRAEGKDNGTNGSGGKDAFADTAASILGKEIKTKVDFTIPKGFGQRKKARRFAMNPEANWGPKKAASGRNKRKQSDGGDGEEEPNTKNSKTS